MGIFQTFGIFSYSAHAQIQNTGKNAKNAEKQKNFSNK